MAQKALEVTERKVLLEEEGHNCKSLCDCSGRARLHEEACEGTSATARVAVTARDRRAVVRGSLLEAVSPTAMKNSKIVASMNNLAEIQGKAEARRAGGWTERLRVDRCKSFANPLFSCPS